MENRGLQRVSENKLQVQLQECERKQALVIALFNFEDAVEKRFAFSYGVFCENSAVHLQVKQNARTWGCSSAGRAPALQAGGQGFDSPHLHQEMGP